MNLTLGRQVTHHLWKTNGIMSQGGVEHFKFMNKTLLELYNQRTVSDPALAMSSRSIGESGFFPKKKKGGAANALEKRRHVKKIIYQQKLCSPG